MKESIVRACAKAFFFHVGRSLTSEDWEDIHPVPISVAVNGYPGIPNMDAQKHTTSAGHGHRGSKLQFLTEPEKFEEWDSFREYDKKILGEIDTMREELANGVRPHAIYDACFKDEMLSRVKVDAGKARAIYMCPVAFLVNMRMSTMGLCRVMIRRRDLFGIAVGLNTHSEEWDDAFKLAQRISGDNWIASDFQAFESVLSLLISNAVSWIIVELCKASGNFTESEIMVLRTLLADVSNATINFFGELITLLGGEASGQQLTTFFNCLANNLLHMYAYVDIYSRGDETETGLIVIAESFFDNVVRNTLGDDVYLKVSPDRPEYNHTSITKVFSGIGITYTMADKTAESRPYISHTEVTFLKRKFVDHECFPGMKVAALDPNSIYKMLCYTIPSKGCSDEEQLAAALASAQAEAFFHGKAFFDQIAALIEDLPKTPELCSRMAACPPPTWGQMYERFLKASPKLKAIFAPPLWEQEDA
jgi:hypothetical protein